MKTIKVTKKAKLQFTKTWGYTVINYTKKIEGKPTAKNYNQDLKGAEKEFEKINQ